MRPRRSNTGKLRVALLRGSANANVERLATLMSLDGHCFSVHIYTSNLDASSEAMLHDAHGTLKHTHLHDAKEAQITGLGRK